jgi:hypothetical protein
LGEVTTVKVTKRTRDRLAELGNKKETYDDIISKLIKFYEENASGRNERVSRK